MWLVKDIYIFLSDENEVIKRTESFTHVTDMSVLETVSMIKCFPAHVTHDLADVRLDMQDI